MNQPPAPGQGPTEVLAVGGSLRGGEQAGASWVASMEPELDHVPGLRRRARAFLEEIGVVGLVLDDAALVASELLANAVEASIGGHTIQLSLEADADVVVVAVSNVGADFEPPDTADADPLRSRGRGLQMARAAADQVEVAHVDGVTTVTCTFERGAEGRTAGG